MLLHDWIHVTADKTDIRETVLQFTVNIVQIASHKMMQTNRKQQNCPWMVPTFVQHICHTFDSNIFQVAVSESCSSRITKEKRSAAFISAAVSTTPRMQLSAQT